MKCRFALGPVVYRVSLVALALLTSACGESQEEADESAVETAPTLLTVAAVNYPLAYFAERIGGEHVAVEFPVPPDVDPAFWQPDTEAIGVYQRAEVILLNGAGYAGWVDHVSLSPSRLVDTSKAFEDRLIPIQGNVTHTHGPDGEHSHDGYATTTWLDPQLAMQQAEAITAAFVRRRPLARRTFEMNLQLLQSELAQLDEEQSVAVAADPGRLLLGSHPVYQYLARRYDIQLRSVHWEPEQDLAPAGGRELEGLLRSHPAGWMLWEAPPSVSIVAQLEKRGVASAVFNPCANRPPTGDLMEIFRANAQALQRAYSASGGGNSD